MKIKITNKLIIALLAFVLSGLTTTAQSGWVNVYSNPDSFMRDICFVPGSDGLWQSGWAIAAEGYIAITTDGGDTWTTVSQSYSTLLGGISFADETTGMIATIDGKILKSDDGGYTWSVVHTIASGGFDKIACKDDQNWVAIGSQKVYSSDGGLTWLTGSGSSSYWDMDYGAGDTYYAIALGGAMGKTTDGGETWADMSNFGQMGFMTDFFDESTGMYGGDLSTIKTTQDGGSTWITNTLGGGQDAINTGAYFDADTIYATGSSGELFKSTDAGANWALDTSFSDFYPRGTIVTGMNQIFMTGWTSAGPGEVWRKIGVPPIGAEFEADQTEVCEGSAVNFTDISIGNIDAWTWTFEGGTPATSTDQNPTVTYNTPGNYFVKLVVAIGTLEDSLTIVDYINVYELPAQANDPSGETSVCSNTLVSFTTNEVAYAQSYDWELSDSEAGTLTWDMTEATIDVADTYSGTFTLKVRASNVCGNGDWSDELEITAYASPEDFDLLGGGEYCLDGDGVEITLSGSQTGVDYELFVDGISTEIIVPGTGSEISFGLLTQEGYYEAVASNGNCDLPMVGQIQVIILYPPMEPATPEGPMTICTETSSDYTSEGSDDADSYVWTLSPEEAGTITSSGLEATVTWDPAFGGTAMISLTGINDCGEGNPSEAIEVSVGAPSPVIEGEEMVCDFSSEIYETVNNEGSIFAWVVTGGTIADGQGTNMITVDWNGEGSGTVLVSEETADGCSGDSEEFAVLIDDCTGIGENDLMNQVSIFPNPAKEFVTISSEVKINSIAVYSMTGGLVENIEIENLEYLLTTSGFTKGFYFIKINSEKGIVTKRLIIQ